MDAQELSTGELQLELVDAPNRGLEAPFVGDEPDIVAVGLGELDLGPGSRTMLSPLTPTIRDGRFGPGSGRSRSSASPYPEPKNASVPIGWSARNTGRRVIRQGSPLSSVTTCVEPIHSWSRCACLIA